MWDKRINQRVIELLEDKIHVFKKESIKFEGSDSNWPFVNSINVKLRAKDIHLVVKRQKKDEYVEQKFKIAKSTRFLDLKEEACSFWGLDKDWFSLYDENFHDLMYSWNL